MPPTWSPSSRAFVKQLLDHTFCLTAIPLAEEIEMVEHVIQVVQHAPCLVPSADRTHFPVPLVEARPKAPEQLGHREIGFAVTVIDGRIEHDRGAIREEPSVPAPEVAVKQRWRRLVSR